LQPDSLFERELPDAEVVISQPFWPAYLTAERIAKAKKLKLAVTAGIGSDHVDLQAAIIYNVGGVQPVARERFDLLTKDLQIILRSAGIQDIGTLGLLPLSDPDSFKRTMAVIRRHSVASATTDLQGKARFDNVKAGTYYVFGMTETRGGFSVWNLKTLLVPGQNSVILDNKNAAIAF